MRCKIVLVSVMALLLCFNLSMAADFEGKIVQRLSSLSVYDFEDVASMSQAEKFFSKSVKELRQMAAQSGDEESFYEQLIDIYVKGNMIRIDTREDGQRVSMIYDTGSRKMTTLQHDEKTAMVTDMGQMMEMSEQMAAQMGVAPGMMDDEMESGNLFSMKPAGETKTINGLKCELYKGTDSEGGFTHMWIHKGYADVFDSLAAAFSKMEGAENAGPDKEEQFFKKIKGIPVVTKSISMGELMIDEIVEISRQSVSKDKFAVPADYKKMDMQQMMQQQMKQMQEMMQQ